MSEREPTINEADWRKLREHILAGSMPDDHSASKLVTRIQAHVKALTEERDRWHLIADETSKAAVETLAHVEALEGERDRAVGAEKVIRGAYQDAYDEAKKFERRVEALEGALRTIIEAEPSSDANLPYHARYFVPSAARAALAGEPDKGGAWTHGYSGESEEWVKGPTTTDEHGRKVFTMHRGEPTPPPPGLVGMMEPEVMEFRRIKRESEPPTTCDRGPEVCGRTDPHTHTVPTGTTCPECGHEHTIESCDFQLLPNHLACGCERLNVPTVPTGTDHD